MSDDPASEHVKCICAVKIYLSDTINNYNVNVIVKFSVWIDCFQQALGSIDIPAQLGSMKMS